MSDQVFPYVIAPITAPRVGLIALQSDETIEADFRRSLAPEIEWIVSRVPSAPTVSRESLGQMEGHLTAAARLFPEGVAFDVIAYGCTSGTAQIGADRIADLIGQGASAKAVTNPVTALVAACKSKGITQLALLSPYVAEVSDHLRHVLRENGIETPVIGSFDVAEEAAVVRIDEASIIAAARALVAQGHVDGLFLSCTNLRTLNVLPQLERQLGMPVLSSNQVLAWHIEQLSRW